MAVGANPITGAVITLAGQGPRPLRGFIVRKEAKAHGKGRDVEGPVKAGDRVVIVEDVVTTGGSSLLAIEKVEAAGMVVDKVVAIVDRLEGGTPKRSPAAATSSKPCSPSATWASIRPREPAA
jgi:orotate phosphoribosyltransferase